MTGLLHRAGLGIHHAGMLRSDRSLMERAFAQGIIKARVAFFGLFGSDLASWRCSLLVDRLFVLWPPVLNASRFKAHTSLALSLWRLNPSGAVLHGHPGLGRQPAGTHRHHQGHPAVQPAEGRLH